MSGNSTLLETGPDDSTHGAGVTSPHEHHDLQPGGQPDEFFTASAFRLLFPVTQLIGRPLRASHSSPSGHARQDSPIGLRKLRQELDVGSHPYATSAP